MRRAMLGEPEARGIADAVLPRSVLSVPLQVHGRWFGAWLFVRTHLALPFDDTECALADDLARRVALALDHERLYHEAQAMVRSREEFVSIASHELRTPLTTVKGYAQFLAHHVRQPDWDRARLGWLAQQLLGQVNRLEVLVGDLLDASRLQQGRLELRPEAADLVELARQALAHFAVSPDQTDQHTFVLDAPEPLPGRWDPARLDQVLSNLISNAVKYSPNGGEIRVSVRRLDGQAELRVKDHGIGIPANEQAGLFRPFARSETVRRSVNGVGLGLYITAQIVARHQGTILVESAPGSGSTFIVRLPIHADATVVDLGPGPTGYPDA
jgi:signal transduction histidine kinase